MPQLAFVVDFDAKALTVGFESPLETTVAADVFALQVPDVFGPPSSESSADDRLAPAVQHAQP